MLTPFFAYYYTAFSLATKDFIAYIRLIFAVYLISVYLEVLPEYQNSGIGKELVSRMINSLDRFYMVDLLCDPQLQDYYRKFGMSNATGAFLRNYRRQSGK